MSENIPPASKRSMVSEELDVKAMAEKEREKMQKSDYIPSTEVLLLFAVEKLHDIAVNVAEIADAFKRASGMFVPKTEGKQIIEPKSVPIVEKTVQSTSVQVPVTSPEVDARFGELQGKLKDFLELLNIETDKPMFYIIRPKQFLGGENFAKIVKIVKDELGGDYVSQGKASHFRVPKVKQ